MSALINETEQSKILELLHLLKNRIHESMIQDTSIVISIESPIINLLKTFYIFEYQITIDQIYIESDNAEFHMDFKKITDFSYNNEEECFTIIHNEMKIILYFM